MISLWHLSHEDIHICVLQPSIVWTLKPMNKSREKNWIVEFNRLNTIETEIEIHNWYALKNLLTLPLEIKCHMMQTSGEHFEYTHYIYMWYEMEKWNEEKEKKKKKQKNPIRYSVLFHVGRSVYFLERHLSHTARVVMNYFFRLSILLRCWIS